MHSESIQCVKHKVILHADPHAVTTTRFEVTTTTTNTHQTKTGRETGHGDANDETLWFQPLRVVNWIRNMLCVLAL